MAWKKNNTLLQWVFSHKEEIDFRLTENKWPEDFPVSIFDFDVSINYDGVKSQGRGRHPHKDIALLKSISECFERFFLLKSNFQNSNGFASHTSLDQAKINGVLELIERDLFLCHYLTFENFCDITEFVTKSHTAHLFSISASYFQKKGIELRAILLSNDTDFTSVMCIGFGESYKKPFGVNLGFGCNFSFDVALESATLECITNLVVICSDSEVDPIYISNLDDPILPHQNASRDLYMAKYFRSHLSNHIRYPCHKIRKFKEIYAKTTFIEFKGLDIFSQMPLFTVHAINNDLQSLYFGPTKLENVNLSRLNEFLSSFEISSDTINYKLHPVT